MKLCWLLGWVIKLHQDTVVIIFECHPFNFSEAGDDVFIEEKADG